MGINLKSLIAGPFLAILLLVGAACAIPAAARGGEWEIRTRVNRELIDRQTGVMEGFDARLFALERRGYQQPMPGAYTGYPAYQQPAYQQPVYQPQYQQPQGGMYNVGYYDEPQYQQPSYSQGGYGGGYQQPYMMPVGNGYAGVMQQGGVRIYFYATPVYGGR